MFLIARSPPLPDSPIYTRFRQKSSGHFLHTAPPTFRPKNGLSSLAILADFSQHLIIPFRRPLVVLPATSRRNSHRILKVSLTWTSAHHHVARIFLGVTSLAASGIAPSFAVPVLEGPVLGPAHRLYLTMDHQRRSLFTKTSFFWSLLPFWILPKELRWARF